MNNVAINRSANLPEKGNIVLLGNAKSKYIEFGLNKLESDYVKEQIEKYEKKFVPINQLHRWIFIHVIEEKKERYKLLEACRKMGNELLPYLNNNKIETITIIDTDNKEQTLAYAEGLALGNYQFLKYFSDADKKENALKNIQLFGKNIKEEDIQHLQIVVDATCKARTLVNEPFNYLTAVQLSKEIQSMGKEAGFNVEVMDKSKITALKMGGLLAVNKGSVEPPTFSILTWKPENAKNTKPYLLVGKGLVFDSGGLNIKVSNMEEMKCDMSGGAAVACSLYAIARAKLPVYVIGLVPATDNRPGGNAYVPGDVIKMYNGMTVEIKNTDAEGRMILADALSYAKKYNPELIIDIATLTGSAVKAIGYHAIASMGTAEEKHQALKVSGNNVYERLVEFPLWEEYGEMIKSDVADIKNGGGSTSGAITAGKFLEHFTDYPWIHLDIAGPAFLEEKNGYRAKGGTGIGVRLFFDFFKHLAK